MYVYERLDLLCPYKCSYGTECVCVLGPFSHIFCVSLLHTQAASPTHSIHINIPEYIFRHVFHSLLCPWRGGRGALTVSPGSLWLGPCAVPSHTAGVRSVHSLPSPARTPTHLCTRIVLKFPYVYFNILKYIARSLCVCMHLHLF